MKTLQIQIIKLFFSASALVEKSSTRVIRLNREVLKVVENLISAF